MSDQLKIVRVLVYEGSEEVLRHHFSQRYVVGVRDNTTFQHSSHKITEYYLPGDDFHKLVLADDELNKQVQEALKNEGTKSPLP